MKLLRAFRFAFAGAGYLFATQWNARIHLIATAMACALAWWLGISRVEWLVLILVCTVVLALEAVNTAIEAVVDLASPEIHPLAKCAKDLGAAAVLIAAMGAAVVGCVMFLPYLLARFWK